MEAMKENLGIALRPSAETLLSPSPLQLYLPELRKGARQTGKVHGGLAPTIVPLWQAWWWEDEE